MRVVFLDTVGLIALWDRTDQWHEAATAAKRAIDVPGVQAVTTTFVLLEFGNAAARKPYRADVGDFRQALAEEGNLIDPTDDDVGQAWAAYARGSRATRGSWTTSRSR